MSCYSGPNTVEDGLLLSLDFKNSKIFNSLGTNLITHPNYDASTWNTAFYGIRETGILAPDGTNSAVRIYGIVKSGTYSVTSNVATVTITNHGLSGGNHYFDFTSGTAPDGFYSVTIVDSNTFTISITTANTSGNVTVRYRCGQRLTLSAFTPNGTDTYTLSFWARLISLGNYGGSPFSADLHDGNPSLTYTSELIQNKWVKITKSGIPINSSRSFLDLISDSTTDFVIDLWGAKLENQTADNSSITIKDNVGGNVFEIYRPEYSKQNIDSITFTRTVSTPKWGGVCFSTLSGNLAVANYMYNDHTTEVWFRIDDRQPGVYGDSNLEGFSLLAAYNGYHAGFMYTASNMQYFVWNGISTSPTCAIWTVGTSGTQIIEGNWYQIAVVKSGSTFIPYLNGENVGTGYSPTLSSTGIGTTNQFRLGAAAKASPGSSNYVYYAKNTVSQVKMYGKSLTAQEIRQNFNASRGRYGI